MTEPSLETLREQLERAADLRTPPPELTFRPMFGGVSAYIEGRIFCTLSNIGLALKLSGETQDDLLKLPDAKRLRYEPDAPESKQYIVVPQAVCSDEDALAVWVGHSVAYVRTLPAPKPKSRPAGTKTG